MIWTIKKHIQDLQMWLEQNYIERKTPPLTILWIETKLVYHLPPHLSSQIGDTMQGLNEHRFGNAIIEDARLRFLDAIEIDELEV